MADIKQPSTDLDQEKPRDFAFGDSLRRFLPSAATLLALTLPFASGNSARADELSALRKPETPAASGLDPGARTGADPRQEHGRNAVIKELTGVEGAESVRVEGLAASLTIGGRALELELSSRGGIAAVRMVGMRAICEPAIALRELPDLLDCIGHCAKGESGAPLPYRPPGFVEIGFDSGAPKVVIAGTSAFVAVPRASDADRARLAELERNMPELAQREAEALKAAAGCRGYGPDYKWLESSRDTRQIDIAHMPPDVMGRFESARNAMRAHDAAKLELSKLSSLGRQYDLEHFAGRADASASQTVGPGGRAICIHDRDGYPERILRFEDGRGLAEEIELGDVMLALAGPKWRESRAVLEKHGELVLPAMEGFLRSRTFEDPKTEDSAKGRAALIMCGLGREEAIPRVFRSLGSGCMDIEDCFEALCKLGAGHSGYYKAAMLSPSAESRLLAVRLMKRFPDHEDAACLRQALRDPDGDVQMNAALALGALGRREALPHLEKIAAVMHPAMNRHTRYYLPSDYEDYATAAANILACDQGAAGLKALVRAEKKPGTFNFAHNGLYNSVNPAALDHICEMARRYDPGFAISDCLRRWAERGEEKAVLGLVAVSSKPGSDFDQKLAAARALSELTPSRGDFLATSAAAVQRGVSESKEPWLHAALERFVKGREIGIEFPERFEADTFAEIYRNRTAPEMDCRRLAVVVGPRGDHNGCFQRMNSIVRSLIDRGYRVMYYEAGTDKEFCEALAHAHGKGTDREQQASVIMANGHGSTDTLQLERDDAAGSKPGSGYIDLKDGAVFKDSGASETLEDGGTIILFSCSTGNGKSGAENLANYFRKWFPKAGKIHAPAKDTYLQRLIFEDDGTIERPLWNLPIEDHYEAMRIRLRQWAEAERRLA